MELGAFSVRFAVKDIHDHLKKWGIKLSYEADLNLNGPAYITLTDHDGNDILIDQYR
jgi:hypothetical protein